MSIAAVLLVHVAVALVAPLAVRWLGRRVFYLCAVAPVITLIWAAGISGRVVAGERLIQRIDWVGPLGLGLDLRIDGFSMLMVVLIAGVGLAIFIYCRFYFSDRPDLGRFAATLSAFAGSMLGVVLADNLIALYVFWELTSITSYLLIGFEDGKAAARSAALQAILVTGAGGLAMLAGFVILGQAAGSYSISALLESPPAGAAVGAGLILVLLGAFTKSAQVPFHFWLPGAMAAPTPVSAYLHSATMVKAGVYLIALLAPAFADSVPFWRPLVIGVGLATMLVGGLRALVQHDLKLLLAFGTVSQLGFLVVLVGSGHPDLSFAGVAMILAHGLFKAALFMSVGIIDHQARTRDLRRLSGAHRSLRSTMAVAVVASASMVGLPPLFGFISKEAAFEAVLHDSGWVVSAGIIGGSVLTFAYTARFLWGGFADKELGHGIEPARAFPAAAAFVAPAAALALLTLLLGLVPGPADKLVSASARSLDPEARGSLALWHGFTPALGFSVLTVAAGLAMFFSRDRVHRLLKRFRVRLSASEVYDQSLKGLNRSADRITGFFQNGSLPVYIAVILLSVVAIPSWALIHGFNLPGRLVFAESWGQVAVGAGILAGAVFVARVRQRLVAVLLLGAVGFGVAVLFVMQGAPDLALTQLLIETLALVIFVMVLRHLPSSFRAVQWRFGQALRVVVSGCVGIFVATFALLSAHPGGDGHLAREYIERALPEGGGRNVVNVILTDFRALDTLGEITVLTVAAFGIASLVLVGRNREEEPDEA
ncbi:MAG: hydrogen gas-evolving membrane-bound hydrogenase subunit E [Actinomycetota bacterium]